MNDEMNGELKKALTEYSLHRFSCNLLQAAKDLAETRQGNPYFELIIESMLVKDNAEACVLLGDNYDNGYGVYENKNTAKTFYSKAVAGGNVLGHYSLGWHYYSKEDNNRAIDEFKKALQQEEQLDETQIMDAHTCLGDAYTKIAEPKYTDAITHLSIAANRYNNAFAKRKLGYIYSDPSTRVYDPQKSIPYLQNAINDGDTVSCHILASYFIDGVKEAGIEKNYREAERILLPHADSNDYNILNDLGWIYFHGDKEHGFPNENDKAESFYRRALRLDPQNMKITSNLGYLCYCQGNFREAENLLCSAAARGVVSFSDFLGRIYKEGLSGQIDLEKAAYYYGKAYDMQKFNNVFTCMEYMHVLLDLGRFAEAIDVANYGIKEYNDVEFIYHKARIALLEHLGDMDEIEAEETIKAIANQFSDYSAEAYRVLGEYYKRVRRFARAIEAFSLSFENGNAEAAVEVGRLYEKGGGSVSSDVNQAVVWFRKAANAGSEAGKKELACFKSGFFGTRRVSW